MNKTLKFCRAIIALTILSGCQTTADHMKKMNWEVGKTYSGSINMSRFDLPLPEGEWILSTATTRSLTSGKPVEEFILLKLHEGYVAEVFAADASLPGGRTNYKGWAPSSVCETQNAYHVQKNAYFRMNQDCWLVAGARFTPKQYLKPGRWLDMWNFIEDQRYLLRKDVIVRTHFFANSSSFFRIYHYTTMATEYRDKQSPIPADIFLWLTKSAPDLPKQALPYVEYLKEQETKRHKIYANTFKHIH